MSRRDRDESVVADFEPEDDDRDDRESRRGDREVAIKETDTETDAGDEGNSMQVDTPMPFNPPPTPAAAAQARAMMHAGRFGPINTLTGLPEVCNWSAPVITTNWESATGEGKNLTRLHAFGDRQICEGDALKYSADYLGVMDSSTKGTLRIKTLSVQLMAKHGPIFPQHHRQTFEVMMSLTKDWWAVIRAYAVKGLASVCVDENGEPIMEAVHAATERLMLFYHEHKVDKEGMVVQTAIKDMLRIDAQTVCLRLLTFLEGEGAEADAKGESACRILRDWVMPCAPEFLHPKPEIEEMLRSKIKKVLEVASEEEFKLLIEILRDMRIFGTQGKYGVQGIVDMVAEQATLTSTLDPSNTEELQRVLECVNIALPYYKRGARDDKLSSNIARKILPVFCKFAGTPVQLLILRRLCELGPYVTRETAGVCLKPVFSLLLQHLSRESSEKSDEPAPELAFNLIEGFLFLTHCYGYKDRRGLIDESGIPLDGEGNSQDRALFRSFRNRVRATVDASEEMLVQLQGALPKVLQAGETDKALAVQTSLEQGIAAIRNISDLTKPLLAQRPHCVNEMPSGKFSWLIPKAAPKRVIEPERPVAFQGLPPPRQFGMLPRPPQKGKIYEPPIRRPVKPRIGAA